MTPLIKLAKLLEALLLVAHTRSSSKFDAWPDTVSAGECVVSKHCESRGNLKTDSGMQLKSSGYEESPTSPNATLSSRYFTEKLPLNITKWPDGEVLWCTIGIWPDDMVPPKAFLYDGKLDWLLVQKEVHDMFSWAAAAWNPDKGANIRHKTCGHCPCDRPALPVKVSKQFAAHVGYSGDLGRNPKLGFTFHYLPETYRFKERMWIHEFGHVLGFRHEHQRPDLWDDGNPTFKLNIQVFPEYSHFFECENGYGRGKLIPPEIVHRLNSVRGNSFRRVKEGDRYGFYLLSHNYRYARFAGAPWYDILPVDGEVCGWEMEMAHGRGGIGADPDAVMMYYTGRATFVDAETREILFGFSWAEPRYNFHTGEVSDHIPLNINPSTAERERLKAMYPLE